jgi:hypothetical protein
MHEAQSIHVTHQLSHIHLKRKVNTAGGVRISTVLLPVPFDFPASFKKNSVIKNRDIKVMAVGSVMISPWRHNE